MELLKRFQWNYASFVHSDSEYGTTGYQLVKNAVQNSKNICLADPITIYNKQFDSEDYKRVVNTLINGDLNDTIANNNENPMIKPQVVIGKTLFIILWTS